MVAMPSRSVRRYLRFFTENRSTYIQFNRQLFIGELAGFGAGLVAAEASAYGGLDNLAISVYSSGADYGGSIAGFMAIFYKDNEYRYHAESRIRRLKIILKNAFRLWPSALAADVSFILVRPYFHYVSLSLGLEAGIAAILAHFLAFGVFNLVAIVSKSMLDYVKHTGMNPV